MIKVIKTFALVLVSMKCSSSMFIDCVHAQTLPASGRIAYHNYSQYDIVPGNPNGPTSLDGQVRLYDFAEDAVSTVPIIDKHVRHAINPNFSADGSKIVFMGLPRGPSYGSNWPSFLDIFEYDFQNGTLRNLSNASQLNPSIDEDPIFGPNDETVIFKRDRDDLWSIDLATMQPSKLFNSPVEVSGPKISPSGHEIAYWANGGASANVFRRQFLPGGGVGPALAVADVPSVQEYYPSYLTDTLLAYSRWPNSSTFDDEIYIYDTVTSQSAKAAFSLTGTADESDAFRVIGSTTVGFSSTRFGGKGGYDMYVGDPVTGATTYLQVASTSKEDLGGSFHTSTVGIATGLLLLDETFTEPAANQSAFESAYGASFASEFDNTNVAVVGGRLELATTTGFGEASVTAHSFVSPDAGIVIIADIGADSSNGDFNVGIVLDDTPIVFHPGYETVPGAFRIGTGSNLDMGFVPANGVLHHWEIEVSPVGQVSISITDGSDPNNTYSTSYADASLADGFSVGLHREGGAGSAAHAGLFDNFMIALQPGNDSADFDGNGSVDGQDFLAWQQGFGIAGSAVHSDGDANTDYSVNGLDLAIWESTYGFHASAVIAVIPEPNCFLLLASGVCLLVSGQRQGFVFCMALRPGH
jgi:hypothetical protein